MESDLIEYVGVRGISAHCRKAVTRLLQYGDRIRSALILTHRDTHCLLLTVNEGHRVAVKSGFASGYGGEGPRTFSYVLGLLAAHGADIDEYDVSSAMIDRVDRSALRASDLTWINTAESVRPVRWSEYISEKHAGMGLDGTLWNTLPPVIPFALIDRRIIDLAVGFWGDADRNLVAGYRRLEDLLRERIESDACGERLLKLAFGREAGRLEWKDTAANESEGRLQLFTGAFKAYRNRRAHREVEESDCDHLSELLLLNQLFRLETQATERPAR